MRVHTNPALQSWLTKFCLQLLKAGQTEHEPVKDRQEDGRRGDVGSDAGIGESSGGGTEIENLVEITGKGADLVAQAVLLSHESKIGRASMAASLALGIVRSSWRAGVSAVARVAAAVVPG